MKFKVIASERVLKDLEYMKNSKNLCSIPKLFHSPTSNICEKANKKIRWIIKQLEKGAPVREIAGVMRVTRRRIYQLKKRYEGTGTVWWRRT